MSFDFKQILDFHLPINLHPNHHLYIEKAYERISSNKETVINLINKEYSKYEQVMEEYIAVLISAIYYETGDIRKKYKLITEEGREKFEENGIININDKITDVLDYHTGAWTITSDPNNNGKVIYLPLTFHRITQSSVNENISLIIKKVYSDYIADIKCKYAPSTYKFFIPNKPPHIVSENKAQNILNIIFKEEINTNTNIKEITDISIFINKYWNDKTLKDILKIAEPYRRQFWLSKEQNTEPEKIYKNYCNFIKKISIMDFIIWKNKIDKIPIIKQ